MNNSISIHEDDYCQLQLLPHENIDFIRNEMEEIIGFSSENYNENGYKNIYVRKKPNIAITEKNITRSELENLIINFNFEKIQDVNIGYGNSYNKSLNYGFGTKECAILFECEKDDIVITIWLNFYWIATEKQKQDLEKLLIKIKENWNLLLIDWNQNIAVELSENNIKKYLND